MKFWLNVGRDEQRDRFLDRIDEPESNWKFNPGDVAERKLWDQYMAAYEDALNETSRPWAPWYAIPADNKRFMRRTVADIVLKTLEVDRPAVPDGVEEGARGDAALPGGAREVVALPEPSARLAVRLDRVAAAAWVGRVPAAGEERRAKHDATVTLSRTAVQALPVKSGKYITSVRSTYLRPAVTTTPACSKWCSKSSAEPRFGVTVTFRNHVSPPS